MDNDGMHALHWKPEKNRSEEVGWDDFLAFRAFFTPFKPLRRDKWHSPFRRLCVCGEGQTYNIIPHKYLVEPSGKIGRDNFYGWNRKEREDFNRLRMASEHKPGEREGLREIQEKGGKACTRLWNPSIRSF